MIKSLGLKTHLRDASDILSPSCWHNPVHVALNLKFKQNIAHLNCTIGLDKKDDTGISNQLTYVLKSYDNINYSTGFFVPFLVCAEFPWSLSKRMCECTNLKFQSHPHRQFSGSICRFHAADMKVKLVTMSSANLLTPFWIQTLNEHKTLYSIMSSSKNIKWFGLLKTKN